MPALAARAARIVARIRLADRVRLPFNLVVSNVPEPREPLFLAGREVIALYPIPTIADGQGLT